MLYFRTGLAAVAITVASASNSASGEDSCQNIIAWDCGSGAAIELPSKLHDVVAIDAGDIFSVALRSNGQVVVWGNPPADPVEVGGTSYEPYLIPRHIQFQTSAIAAGQEHGLALTSIGKLKRWHQDYTPSHNGIFPGF